MIYLTEKEKFVDFATVRDMLEGAQERRGDLTYEQVAALQHAQWAAGESRVTKISDATNKRMGYKTVPSVFNELMADLLKMDALAQYPNLAAKLAELIPLYPSDVKAVLISKRIAIDDSEINTILDKVRQHYGIE